MEAISFLSDRAEPSKSSAIYLLSLEGGEAIPLTKAKHRRSIGFYAWSPNGKFIAFISPDEQTAELEKKEKEKDDAKVYGEHWEYNRLRLFHIATGEVRTLFAMDLHVDKFAWKDDSSEIIFSIHETPDVDSAITHGINIKRISVGDRNLQSICAFPNGIGNIVWYEKKIYFTAVSHPKTYISSQALYRVAPGGISSKAAHGVHNCVGKLCRAGSLLVLEVRKGLLTEIKVLNGEFADDESKGVWSFEEELAIRDWDVTGSASSPILTVLRSSGGSPTEVFSVLDGKASQLSAHGKAVAELKLCDAAPFYCKAKDGTDLDAVLFRPTNTEKKALPAVVWVHGGPYHRTTIGFDDPEWYHGAWLASSGYAVLCPNPRGSSGRGEKFASAVRGAVGTVEYEDVISIVEEGVSRGIIDGQKVGIGGYSAGGLMSYLAVTRPDFHFKAACCGAGVSDWDLFSMTADIPRFGSEMSGGAPWEVKQDSTKSRHGSALWNMHKVTTPILILHGEQDTRVPVSQAIAFHRGCLHHNIPCEMVIYPREPHSFRERKHMLDMFMRIGRFYDSNLLS